MNRAARSSSVFYAIGGLLVIAFVVLTWQDYFPWLKMAMLVAGFSLIGVGGYFKRKEADPKND